MQDSEFRVQGSRFRVQGSGCMVQGAGFRVQGSGDEETNATLPTIKWPTIKETGSTDEYRGTSLVRNSLPLGPYSRTMPRALWCS